MPVRRQNSLIGAVLVILAALVLVGLTWFGTYSAVEAEQREATARVTADISNQALVFEDQLRRELLVLEQTLRILEHAWEGNQAGFDLLEWRQRTLVLPEITLHLFIADKSGIITASTRPELVGVDVSGRDYFKEKAALRSDDGAMFIGPATRGLVTNRWQMNMARRLDTPSGAFAGVIVVSYDTGALTRLYRKVDLGERGMIALVGTDDGRLRALVGPTSMQPGADISHSPMFEAMTSNPDGTWRGPSAMDGVERIHAFRQVPDRDLAVVLALDLESALPSSVAFRNGALIFAAGTTLFIAIVAAGVLRERAMARRREEKLGRDRAVLSAANEQLDLSRMRADAKSMQLEATLTGMSDGVSMLDGNLRLVAWNDLFAEFAGLPREILRVGVPMEDLLRAQARAGEFGPVNVEAEVARRMALLRLGNVAGTTERPRPGGRTLELRRSMLPGGGFVTLYTDITGRKLAEDAMRRAREMAEAATDAKSRFVATVSHEILTPLNTLLNSLRLLADTATSGSQARFVHMARQAGDALLHLMNDILEMSKMEAGRISVRPSLFAIRPLLDSVVDIFRNQAAERGLAIELHVEPDVPELLSADAGRVRQILTNFLSNAVKFCADGTIQVVAERRAADGSPDIMLRVRDPGATLTDGERARLFQPFVRLETKGSKGTSGSGLGLAICRSLAQLMGAEIGCDALPSRGNEFWLRLPTPQAVEQPFSARHGDGDGGAGLPRTRILLVEDVLPNQLVTAIMLRRAGHMVDVASSGGEAVAAAARRPYDVILMDILMPDMGGLEAARRIRALSGAAAAVPIVALTANATDEDFAAYRAAGMNGLVRKPTELAELLATIGRLVWPSHAARPLPGRNAAPEAADPASGGDDADDGDLLSAERVAELRQLKPAVLAELVEATLEELGDRLLLLRDALAAADPVAVEAHAHAMTGAAGGYGLASLERRLRQVLQAARHGDVPAANRAAEGLEATLTRAGMALREAASADPVGS